MAITSLREGDKNDYVKTMQEYLIKLKYDCGTADGIFGRQTTWAVKWFQYRNGLTVDGICGVNTRDKMISSSAVKGVPNGYENWTYGKSPLYFHMNDPLWNSYPYDAANTSKTETVGKTGCGPTTMATIATNLLGKAILPPVLCDWSNKNGHRDPNGADGTRPSFFTECAKKYGLRTAIINISSDNPLTSDHFTLIDQVLRANSLVAASVNSTSPYTNGGHYIMIYKIENGKVYIKDPVKSNNDLAPRAVSDWVNGKWVKRFIRVGK